MNINKAIIVGFLVRDPETKALSSGQTVTTFSVATNSTYKDKQGERKTTVEFHNVVTYGTQAENCGKYLKKGQLAGVEGRIQTRSWDKDDGSKAYRTEIIADTVQFGPKSNGEGGDTPESENRARTAPEAKPRAKTGIPETIPYPEEDINPDDIPF